MSSSVPEEDVQRAQKAQKFYTSAVNLLVGEKEKDEADFLRLLDDYLVTKNKSLVDIQHVFEEYQSEGKTLLHVACSTGKVQAADGILSKCPNVSSIINLQDANNNTPIINATICESIPLMKLLLSHGADVTMCNKDGASALNFAAGDGSIQRMSLLMEHGADVNNTSEAGTPIGWASGKGQTEAVRYLISQKGDVNKSGANNIPPVILSAVASCDNTTALLVEAGADVGAIITGNLTLLHICAEGGLSSAISAILKSETGRKCATVVNSDGNIPIQLAAMSKHIECIKELLPFSGEAYASMSADSLDAVESILKEGVERLALWHQSQSQDLSPQQISPTVEKKEDSTGEHSRPLPLPEVSDDSKAKATEWKDKGNNFFKKLKYVEAIEAYSEGLKIDPTNHFIYSNRSACFHAINKHEECLSDAELCRRLQPSWLKGCFRLATARFALGMYEDAAVAAYEGLQIDNTNDELKSLLQRAVKKGQQEHKAKTRGTY